MPCQGRERDERAANIRDQRTPMSKKSEKDLAKRLHKLGIRKGHASSIARSTGRLEGQLPAGARSSIRDLVSTVGEISDRLSGTAAERKKAAEKAARTRRRNAEKRSRAAKKAGKTRAARA
jgi:hypothetical protein